MSMFTLQPLYLVVHSFYPAARHSILHQRMEILHSSDAALVRLHTVSQTNREFSLRLYGLWRFMLLLDLQNSTRVQIHILFLF